MRIVAFCFSVLVFQLGCSTFGGKTYVSNWSALENAKSLSCQAFPAPKSVLRTRSLTYLEGPTSGFISDVILRNGQPARFFAPNKGAGELAVKDMVGRDFGSDSLVLGGAGISKAVYVALLQQKNNKAKLELRTLPDNIVRFTSNEFSGGIIAGKAHFTRQGVWLAYKAGDGNVAEEDAKVGVIFFRFGKAGKLITETFANTQFPSSARLLVRSESKKALLVWGERGRSNNDFKFFMTELDPVKSTVEDPKRVELPVSSEVESWSAAPYDEGMLIAYVDGDSLVGQSKLVISRVYWRLEYARVAWKREQALTNIHVSEPVWLTVGRQATLMIPKWVDGESTIGKYDVDRDGKLRATLAGIFPKGTRVMTGFHDVKEKDNFAIVRYRNKGAWQFEICKL